MADPTVNRYEQGHRAFLAALAGRVMLGTLRAFYLSIQ
jgi:hypothetical protein